MTLLEAPARGPLPAVLRTGCPGWVVSEETAQEAGRTGPILAEVVLQLVELAIRGRRPGQHHLPRRGVGTAQARTSPPGLPLSWSRGLNGSGGPQFRTDSRPARHLHPHGPAGPVVIAHDDPATAIRRRTPRRVPPRRGAGAVRQVGARDPLLRAHRGRGYAGWRSTQSQYYVGRGRRPRSSYSAAYQLRARPGKACQCGQKRSTSR